MACQEHGRGLAPLGDSDTACVLLFRAIGPMYQPMACLAILAGLRGKMFTGTCECYLFAEVEERDYLTAIGLRFSDPEPAVEWWGELADAIEAACEGDDEVQLDRDGCGFSTIGELRRTLLHAGTAGFENGVATWVSDPAGPDPDSPFTALCRRIH